MSAVIAISFNPFVGPFQRIKTSYVFPSSVYTNEMLSAPNINTFFFNLNFFIYQNSITQ